jgi:hypothetical protein
MKNTSSFYYLLLIAIAAFACAGEPAKYPPSTDAAPAVIEVDATPGVRQLSLLSLQADGYITVSVTAWSDCSEEALLFDGVIDSEVFTLTSPPRVDVCGIVYYQVLGDGIDKLLSWEPDGEERTYRLLFRSDNANLTTTIRITA